MAAGVLIHWVELGGCDGGPGGEEGRKENGMKTHAYTSYQPDKTDLLSVCPHQEAQKVSLSCPLYDQPGGFCVEFMPEENHIRILRKLVDELVTMRAAREFRERQNSKKAVADRASALESKP